MANMPTLEQMMKAGVHFGHQTSHWHPKMKPFLFGEKNDIHIIDLEITQKMLGDAMQYVKSVAERGGKVLFVGTKTQAQIVIEAAAKSCNMPYVNKRWLGGTLTNFSQIKSTIQRYKSLKDQKEKGELKKYTKKEQILLEREMEDMEEKIGGIQTLDRIPEVVFVADVRHEKTALEEAKMMGVKVVGICDANVNPAPVDYIIPGNDDAVKSLVLLCGCLAESIKEGQAQALLNKPAVTVKTVASTAKPAVAPKKSEPKKDNESPKA